MKAISNKIFSSSSSRKSPSPSLDAFNATLLKAPTTAIDNNFHDREAQSVDSMLQGDALEIISSDPSGDTPSSLVGPTTTPSPLGSRVGTNSTNPSPSSVTKQPSPLPPLAGTTANNQPSANRFSFSPTMSRRRKSSTTQGDFTFHEHDDDNLTEDEEATTLPRKQSNRKLKRSATSDEAVTEPQSPLLAASPTSGGFSFTPKMFKSKPKQTQAQTDKSRASDGGPPPSMTTHRRAVSDQAGLYAASGGLNVDDENDLLLLGAAASTDPIMPKSLPRIGSSKDDMKPLMNRIGSAVDMRSLGRSAITVETAKPLPRVGSKDELLQHQAKPIVHQGEVSVILCKFVKTGKPTVWFDPKAETESSSDIETNSKIEVMCSMQLSSGHRLMTQGTEMFSVASDEDVASTVTIMVPLDDHKHACEVTLEQVEQEEAISIPAMMKQTTVVYAVCMGFVSCGVLMEARLNIQFAMQLVIVIAVYLVILAASGKLGNNKSMQNIKFLTRSCRVVASSDGASGQATTSTAASRVVQVVATVQKEVYSPMEVQLLHELRENLWQNEFSNVSQAFTQFYEASEGKKLLKHFQPPRRDHAAFFANDVLLMRKLEERISDDDFMIKYLRAEKMKIAPSTKTAKRALLLRIGLDLDSVPENYPLLTEYINGSVFASAQQAFLNGKMTMAEQVGFRLEHGYTETLDGVPLLIFRPGKIQQRLYHKHVAQGDLGRLGSAMLATLESLRRDAALFHVRTGKPSRIAFAFDLADFAMTNLVSPFTVLQVSRITFPIMTTCYPDFVHKLILCNVPSSFHVFWERLVKPFVSESLTSKLIIIGKGPSCGRELKKYVAEENIPVYLGGKMVGALDPYKGDEFCRDKVGAVGPYLPDKGISLLMNAGLTNGSLERGDEEVTVVEGSNSTAD